MKRWYMILLCVCYYGGMLSLAGCGAKTPDPDEDPASRIEAEGQEEPPAEEPKEEEPKEEEPKEEE